MNTTTITRALAAIRNLDSQISGFRSPVIGVVVLGKIDGKSPEERSNNFTATYQSIIDVLKERSKIKAAIIQSNATHKINVPIYGEVTVAQAIELRSSHCNTYRLITSALTDQVSHARNALDRETERFSKSAQAENADLVKAYSPRLLDPNSLVDNIYTMQKDSNSFDSEIDTLLSEHNAVTTVSW